MSEADAELVARARQGDRVAFAELFRLHRGDVARLIYRLIGPSPDADDLTQEVFLQVYRSLGEFRGQAKFTTWLHSITVNVVRMARRSARSRPTLGELPANDSEPDRALLPDEAAARGQRVAAFQRLLGRLAEKKRVVYVLHEIEGRAPAEIAVMLGVPVMTVRTRLFYARRELSAMMCDEPTLASILEGQRDSVPTAPMSAPEVT